MRSHLFWLTAAVATWASSAGPLAATWPQDDKPGRVVLAPAEDSPEAQKIRQKLADPVTLEFVETPISDVIDFVRDYTGVNVVLDKPALKDERMDSNTPVSVRVQSITLQSALTLLLRPYNLTWLIEDDCLLVTSQLDAVRHNAARAYRVGDLAKSPDDGAQLVRIIQRMLALAENSTEESRSRVQLVTVPPTLIVIGTTREHARVSQLLDDLRGRSVEPPDTVKRIHQKLKDPVTLEFVQTPLNDVIDFLKDYTGVNIVLDKPAIEEDGLNSDTPVSIHVQSIALHAALRILLGQHNLTTMIDNECLIITSKLVQNNFQTLRVYAVAKMLGDRAKINGDEWVRMVTGMAEFEWQTSGYAEMRRSSLRPEVGSSVRVRRASQVVRALIVEVQEKQFKVHYDKSADLADEWVSSEQFQHVPLSLSVIDQLLVEYYEPAGSLVVLAPDSLQKPVENLLGLMVKAAGAGSP